MITGETTLSTGQVFLELSLEQEKHDFDMELDENMNSNNFSEKSPQGINTQIPKFTNGLQKGCRFGVVSLNGIYLESLLWSHLNISSDSTICLRLLFRSQKSVEFCQLSNSSVCHLRNCPPCELCSTYIMLDIAQEHIRNQSNESLNH